MMQQPHIQLRRRNVGRMLTSFEPEVVSVVPKKSKPNKLKFLVDAYRSCSWIDMHPHKIYMGPPPDGTEDQPLKNYRFADKSRASIKNLKSNSFAQINKAWVDNLGPLSHGGGYYTHGIFGYTSEFGINNFVMLASFGEERLLEVEFGFHNYTKPVAATSDFAIFDLFRIVKNTIDVQVHEVVMWEGEAKLRHIGKITLNELVFPFMRSHGNITVNDSYGVNSPHYEKHKNYSDSRPVMEWVCKSVVSGELFSHLEPWS